MASELVVLHPLIVASNATTGQGLRSCPQRFQPASGHQAYLQATTITSAGIVSCQIGTAFAAGTDRASLFTVGVWSNRLLLWGIVFELVFTAAAIGRRCRRSSGPHPSI